MLKSLNEPLSPTASRALAARLEILVNALAAPPATPLHNMQQADTLNEMREGMEHTPRSRLRMSAAKGGGDALDRIRYAEPRGYTLRELEEALKSRFKDVAVSNAQLSRIL